MKKFLVTGANGDIGKPLVKALLEKEYIVAACVRDKKSVSLSENEQLTIFNCDFSSILSLYKLFSVL